MVCLMCETHSIHSITIKNCVKDTMKHFYKDNSMSSQKMLTGLCLLILSLLHMLPVYLHVSDKNIVWNSKDIFPGQMANREQIQRSQIQHVLEKHETCRKPRKTEKSKCVQLSDVQRPCFYLKNRICKRMIIK